MAHVPLEVGDARLGWLIDGSDETPNVSTMLQRSDDGLVLTLPWVEEESPYRRWFGSGMRWGDDPGQTRFQYEPPEMLWFISPDGSIGLVDCYDLGGRNRFPGTGEGSIGIRMAVHGADVDEDYRQINGMQSTVPGLGLWLGQRSFDQAAERGTDGWLSTLRLSWKRDEPIRLSRKLNLALARGFEFQDVVPGDQSLLEDRFRVQTLVTKPRPWIEHLDLHLAIRDLVAIASWNPFDLRHLTVTRDSDPLRTMDGKSHGRQWLKSDVFAYTSGNEFDVEPRFLFDFADVGASGISRWLNVRKRHLRTVQPLMFSLRQSGVPLETHLMQLGAAVESLGYNLALDEGFSKSRAEREPFVQRAQRVIASLGEGLPGELTTWPDDLRRTYRNVKHAEHPLPSAEEAFRLLQTTRLVLRMWLAGRLGVTPETVRRAARLDRMARHEW